MNNSDAKSVDIAQQDAYDTVAPEPPSIQGSNKYSLYDVDEDGDVFMLDVSGGHVTDREMDEHYERLFQQGLPNHPRSSGAPSRGTQNEGDIVISFLKLVTNRAQMSRPRCERYTAELTSHLRNYYQLVDYGARRVGRFIEDLRSRLETYLEPIVMLKFLRISGFYVPRKYKLVLHHNRQRIEKDITEKELVDNLESILMPFKLSPFENIWCIIYEKDNDRRNFEWIGSTAVDFKDLLSETTFTIAFTAGITLRFETEICIDQTDYFQNCILSSLRKKYH